MKGVGVGVGGGDIPFFASFWRRKKSTLLLHFLTPLPELGSCPARKGFYRETSQSNVRAKAWERVESVRAGAGECFLQREVNVFTIWKGDARGSVCV